jgi:hypothetical protein
MAKKANSEALYEKISILYESLNKTGNDDLLSNDVTEIVLELDSVSRSFLMGCSTSELTSKLAPKSYFVFRSGGKMSRPINRALFNIKLPPKHSSLYGAKDLSRLSKEEVARLLYTLTMSFCAAIDICHSGDKKTPATFFEKFIGNLFARELNVRPITKLPMLYGGSLPTDYVFQAADGKSGIHLQTKLSTRERAIEAWGHQKIIEGIFGSTSYRGVLAVLSETNINRAKMNVVDVCVPNQWKLYQRYIARIHRIYYLDVPARTENLHLEEPYVQVKHLAEFFFEKDRILNPSE